MSATATATTSATPPTGSPPPVLLKVHNLKLRVGEPEELLAARVAERLGLPPHDLGRLRILRKSLDARHHDELKYLYTTEVELPAIGANSPLLERLTRRPGVEPHRAERFQWPDPTDHRGRAPLARRPVIVGAGPAGLTAAYFLARDGFRPLVLERGKPVKERVADVRRFDSGGDHDEESNYLFGEGGAGTFSDGKLTCRNTGPDTQRVLELLVECHAKPSIVYEQRPHLGSNRLPLVVRTLRKLVETLGGDVQFGCRVEDIELADGRIRALATSAGRIETDLVILAIGHSARDTYAMLYDRGVPMEFKPFQFGVRIEQPQNQINRARYGVEHHDHLTAADYALRAKGARDLFTFCMCAGGYVMPSVSEAGHFCTNGMSESDHDSPYANSGLVITIEASDLAWAERYGAGFQPHADGRVHPLAGVEFQRVAERLAYQLGRGSYRAPIQTAHDFLAGRVRPAAAAPPASSYPRGVFNASLADFLPPSVLEALQHGLPIMDRHLRGWFLPDATLVGPEARGSSPVRIPRDDDLRESPTIAGLYPCGEGAGYAGGIVSAAVDGLRTARAIVARYQSAFIT